MGDSTVPDPAVPCPSDWPVAEGKLKASIPSNLKGVDVENFVAAPCHQSVMPEDEGADQTPVPTVENLNGENACYRLWHYVDNPEVKGEPFCQPKFGLSLPTHCYS